MHADSGRNPNTRGTYPHTRSNAHAGCTHAHTRGDAYAGRAHAHTRSNAHAGRAHAHTRGNPHAGCTHASTRVKGQGRDGQQEGAQNQGTDKNLLHVFKSQFRVEGVGERGRVLPIRAF